MKTFLLSPLIVAAALVAGCDKVETEPRVQQAPKQPRPIMAAAANAAAGEIDWTVPKAWTQIPAGQMRLAAFQVSQQSPDVVLTVIPLGGDSGGLAANVNRWEGQIGLPSTPAADLPKIVARIEVAGKQVDLVDLMGPESATPRQRLLGAILAHEGRTFYFKLSGRADVVGSQRENFDEFIKSIHFDGPDGHAPAPPAATAVPPAARGAEPLPEGHPPLPGGQPVGPVTPSTATQEFTFTAPEGWVKDGPLPLRIISFHIGEGEKRADLIVSRLPAVGSGTHAENITRWRGQVGLPPLEGAAQQPSTPAIVGGVDSAMFDFVGPGDAQRAKRMLLGWVPKGEAWWFFKFIGPSDVVGQQQANFDAFMKSIKFVEPNAAKPQ